MALEAIDAIFRDGVKVTVVAVAITVALLKEILSLILMNTTTNAGVPQLG